MKKNWHKLEALEKAILAFCLVCFIIPVGHFIKSLITENPKRKMEQLKEDEDFNHTEAFCPLSKNNVTHQLEQMQEELPKEAIISYHEDGIYTPEAVVNVTNLTPTEALEKVPNDYKQDKTYTITTDENGNMYQHFKGQTNYDYAGNELIITYFPNDLGEYNMEDAKILVRKK